ncbi:MAG TPA: peptidylprolyl isomerase, partial [Polyangiaceae bacterium]|nr:peptidylprolyl isomerase [Polyangiaceae bacterium]
HHILLRIKPDATDADKKKAKDDLAAIKKQIEDGADFEKVARAQSKDIETSKEGGSLGCVSKGDWPEAFDKALFSMEKEGGLSDIVETPFGVHLIRLDKVLKGDDMVKAARIRAARKMYVIGESKRLAVEAAKEIQAAAKGGKSLEEAVAAYVAKVSPPPPAPEDKPEDKKDGDKPTDKKDADKKDDKSTDKKEDGDKDDASDDETPPDLALPPTVETSLPFSASSGPFTGAAPGEDPTSIALGLAKPGDVADKLVMMQDSGAAIMQLVEKKGPSDDEWADNREFYVASLRSKKQSGAFADYMKRLRSAHAADIKPNDHFTTDPEDKAKGSGSSAPAEDEP